MPCKHTYTLLRDGVVLATAKEYGKVLGALQADAQKHVCPCDFEIEDVIIENDTLQVVLAAPPEGAPVRGEITVTTSDGRWEFDTVDFSPIDVSEVTGTWETVTVTLVDADDLDCAEQVWTIAPEPQAREARMVSASYDKNTDNVTFSTDGSVGNYVRMKFYNGVTEIVPLALPDTLNTGSIKHTIKWGDFWGAGITTVNVEVAATIGAPAQDTHTVDVVKSYGASLRSGVSYDTPYVPIVGETMVSISMDKINLNLLTGQVTIPAETSTNTRYHSYYVHDGSNITTIRRYEAQTTQVSLFEVGGGAGCNGDRLVAYFTFDISSPTSLYDPDPINGDYLDIAAEFSTDGGLTWTSIAAYNPNYQISLLVDLVGTTISGTQVTFFGYTPTAADRFQLIVEYDNVGCVGGIITRLSLSAEHYLILDTGMLPPVLQKVVTQLYVP